MVLCEFKSLRTAHIGMFTDHEVRHLTSHTVYCSQSPIRCVQVQSDVTKPAQICQVWCVSFWVSTVCLTDLTWNLPPRQSEFTIRSGVKVTQSLSGTFPSWNANTEIFIIELEIDMTVRQWGFMLYLVDQRRRDGRWSRSWCSQGARHGSHRAIWSVGRCEEDPGDHGLMLKNLSNPSMGHTDFFNFQKFVKNQKFVIPPNFQGILIFRVWTTCV